MPATLTIQNRGLGFLASGDKQHITEATVKLHTNQERGACFDRISAESFNLWMSSFSKQ